MLYTDNIGLKKPAYSDPADIADINENMDTIDREFGNRYLKSETYSVEQANNAIAQAIEALPNGLVYHGAVNYYKDLPTANNKEGDTYSVKYQGETGTTADGNEYAWGKYDGTLQWIKLGVNAYTKDDIDEQNEEVKSDILTVKNDMCVHGATLGYRLTNLIELNAKTTTISNVKFTVNPDGTITVNSDGVTNTTNANLWFHGATGKGKHIEQGNYIVSGSPVGGTYETYRIAAGLRTEGESSSNRTMYADYGNGVSITIDNDTSYIDIGIVVKANVKLDNVTFYPVLRKSTDKPSLQEQINALIERIQALETSAGITTASE